MVTDRVFRGGHAFFKSKRFIKRNWVALILDDEQKDSPLKPREELPWIVRVAEKLPLKWMILVLLVLVVVFVWFCFRFIFGYLLWNPRNKPGYRRSCMLPRKDEGSPKGNDWSSQELDGDNGELKMSGNSQLSILNSPKSLGVLLERFPSRRQMLVAFFFLTELKLFATPTGAVTVRWGFWVKDARWNCVINVVS